MRLHYKIASTRDYFRFNCLPNKTENKLFVKKARKDFKNRKFGKFVN